VLLSLLCHPCQMLTRRMRLPSPRSHPGGGRPRPAP
jgi:hypothetical protein